MSKTKPNPKPPSILSSIMGWVESLPPFMQRVISSCVIVPLFIGSIYFGGVIFFILTGAILALGYQEWMAMAEKAPKALQNKFTYYGAAYLAVGLGAFYVLRLLPIQEAGLLTLAFVFMIWASDTGAFISGRLIGGKKLCPTISPGKTWAGFFGGIMAAAFIGLAVHDVFGFYNSKEMGLVIGASISLFAQGGDLAMSKYKRIVGVKDTGTSIPGHGGVLDRVDSIIPAAPIYLIFLFLVVEKTSAILLP